MSTQAAESGFVEVPGARLAYDAAGQGPGLVLVHAGVCDRSMWDPVVPLLASSHRVIRYDCRGFGETQITGDVLFSNRADLMAILDHLGMDRAAIVGVSRAGQIMVDAAIEYPDRFSALIPVAPGLSGADIPMTPEEEVAFAELERLEESRDWPALIEASLRVWVDGLGGSPDRVPAVRDLVRSMEEANHRNHADDPLDQVIVLQPPAAGRLREITAPTLVMVGDLDTPGTLAAARLIAEGVTGARLLILDDVAHLPSMERPHEFVTLVEAFLEEVAG